MQSKINIVGNMGILQRILQWKSVYESVVIAVSRNGLDLQATDNATFSLASLFLPKNSFRSFSIENVEDEICMKISLKPLAECVERCSIRVINFEMIVCGKEVQFKFKEEGTRIETSVFMDDTFEEKKDARLGIVQYNPSYTFKVDATMLRDFFWQLHHPKGENILDEIYPEKIEEDRNEMSISLSEKKIVISGILEKGLSLQFSMEMKEGEFSKEQAFTERFSVNMMHSIMCCCLKSDLITISMLEDHPIKIHVDFVGGNMSYYLAPLVEKEKTVKRQKIN